MLPSRPRLEGWAPDSLRSSGASITDGGQEIANAVRGVDNAIQRMPETRAWEGQAHEAASHMFGRANRQAAHLSEYTTAIGAALKKGAGTIGDARTALLNKADSIDYQGELHVTDQWVVLIKPGRMSAEKVASLQHQAEAEQVEINRLLLAVGDADGATAGSVKAAAEKFGYATPAPDEMASIFPTGPSQPADEVPNPRTINGLADQGIIRGEDMAINVRDSTESTDEDGNDVTTLTMMDGGKHVITTYDFNNSKRLDYVSDNYFGSNGKLLSHTASWVDPGSRVKYTQMDFGDNGGFFLASETPDGTRTAGWTLPDGRHGVLPPDNPFFTSSAPTVIGGGLTGLDAHIGRGGGIPGLTPTSVNDVGTAARFGGPALGLLATMYNAAAAPTAAEACVAGISGIFGVGGDAGGGWAGAQVGALVPPPYDVATIPLFAMVGAFGGGQGLTWVGTKVGEAVCPG